MTLGKVTSTTTTGVQPEDVENPPERQTKRTRETTGDQLAKGPKEDRGVREADGGQKRTGKSKPVVRDADPEPWVE
jgi:hypothetical protein